MKELKPNSQTIKDALVMPVHARQQVTSLGVKLIIQSDNNNNNNRPTQTKNT
jgi:hypothetical protein